MSRTLSTCLFGALALCASVPSAEAGECLHPYYWAETVGRTPKPNNCFGGSGFRCYKAIAGQYFFQLQNPACDPLTAENGCTVQLRVPLQFPGLRDMIDQHGLTSSPTPLVFWYDTRPPPPCPITAPQPNCMQDALCGQPFAGGQFNRDHVETWVERPGITCQNADSSQGSDSPRPRPGPNACPVAAPAAWTLGSAVRTSLSASRTTPGGVGPKVPGFTTDCNSPVVDDWNGSVLDRVPAATRLLRTGAISH